MVKQHPHSATPSANAVDSCAALNGIEPGIIRRAEDLILLVARGEDLVAACAILPETEMIELREAASISHITSRTLLNQDRKTSPESFWPLTLVLMPDLFWARCSRDNAPIACRVGNDCSIMVCSCITT